MPKGTKLITIPENLGALAKLMPAEIRKQFEQAIEMYNNADSQFSLIVKLKDDKYAVIVGAVVNKKPKGQVVFDEYDMEVIAFALKRMAETKGVKLEEILAKAEELRPDVGSAESS